MTSTKNKYTYLPSYIFKTGSKYKQLTDEYEDIFREYIKDNTKKDGLFFGVAHVAEYIAEGFFFSVKENYDSKTNQEKIISAIYYRLTKIFKDGNFQEKLRERIFDLAEESIFYALGIDSYKNRESYLWTDDSFYKNFIKHVSEVVFKSLSHDYLQTLMESIDNNSHEEDVIEDYSSSAEDLLKESGIEWSIPAEIREMIIDYLKYGDDSNMKLIQKYLVLIYASLEK
jgi:hypothetical protein